MPNEKKIPTVRKYISPQDSASVTDYLINLYKNQNVKLPKGISYKDIPDIYSKNVANIPIKFSDLKDKGLVDVLTPNDDGLYVLTEDQKTLITKKYEYWKIVFHVQIV